jgi:hypothetical protein
VYEKGEGKRRAGRGGGWQTPVSNLELSSKEGAAVVK